MVAAALDVPQIQFLRHRLAAVQPDAVCQLVLVAQTQLRTQAAARLVASILHGVAALVFFI